MKAVPHCRLFCIFWLIVSIKSSEIFRGNKGTEHNESYN
ncbi:hypothetical protein GLYMA_04G041551v4 [Glycine max]|nr:hypothetical protein GLYMA_04G041551v4 [Glycine max]KAH1109705.1 hypothetical protein GYH30_008885 [Glycine max]